MPLPTFGAVDRGRTGTVLPPRDFKSLASAYSATTAKNYEAPDRVLRRNLEAPPGIEPGIKVLQTRALPLGYGAALLMPCHYSSHERVLQLFF